MLGSLVNNNYLRQQQVADYCHLQCENISIKFVSNFFHEKECLHGSDADNRHSDTCVLFISAKKIQHKKITEAGI